MTPHDTAKAKTATKRSVLLLQKQARIFGGEGLILKKFSVSWEPSLKEHAP
jgi:hypothetical protein